MLHFSTLSYEASAEDFSQSTEAISYKKEAATCFRDPRSGPVLLPMKDTPTCSSIIANYGV